ncbi:putative Qc-SNARE protein [Trypanosoma theileri]|uniref:Putative Qc-SNARE protein n=1 Tax=Trypanosoma theileri TaxID=67003 RepID=A0A1X0NSP4_9TRYP|nr:putative Qc-SNARE protein [Trypanosoma theileri]ORC87621.1 putative Qc-SNARE protein [Trypanosoma theileri]
MHGGGSSTTRRGEDPWPRMEKEVEALVNSLLVQIQRYRETPRPTVIAENELCDAVDAANEEVEDMRAALDAAINHPELFPITGEELQARAEKTRAWERDVRKALDLKVKIIRERQRRAAAAAAGGAENNNDASGLRENNDFLQQEHDVQRRYMQEDDVTVDRLAGGVRRVKETAVHISDELHTQDRVLDDIDSGMTRAQMHIEGAMKKVGKLLDSASDSKKIMCIVVLLVILVLLIMFVVK